MLAGGLRSLGWRSSCVASVVRARPGLGLRLVAIAGVLAAVPTTILGASVVVTVVVVVVATVALWSWAIWKMRRRLAPPGCLQGVLEGRTTDRLLLRRPTKDDATARLATVDAEVARFNGWRPADVRATSRVCRAPDLHTNACDVLITDKASGRVLGQLVVNLYNPNERRCAIGWWLGPRFRRQGYGTEAVGAALAALEAAGMREVAVGTLPTNTAVRRVCARLGMIPLQTTPWRLPDRRWVQSVWYAHRPGSDPWAGTGLDDPAGRVRSGDAPPAVAAASSSASGRAVSVNLVAVFGLAVAVVASMTAVSHVAFARYKTARDPTRPQAELVGDRLSDSGTRRPDDLARVAQAAGAEVVAVDDISPCDLDGTQVPCATVLVRLRGEPSGLAALSEPDVTSTCWRYTLRSSIHDRDPARAHCPD